MRILRHPLVAQDVRALAEHVLAISGDPAAALRRLDEVDALLRAILENPDLGTRLDGDLSGWRVRHGGRGRAITLIFRPEDDRLLVALVAFGGQDWLMTEKTRRDFGKRGPPD